MTNRSQKSAPKTFFPITYTLPRLYYIARVDVSLVYINTCPDSTKCEIVCEKRRKAFLLFMQEGCFLVAKKRCENVRPETGNGILTHAAVTTVEWTKAVSFLKLVRK